MGIETFLVSCGMLPTLSGEANVWSEELQCHSQWIPV
jgi:hypothetical protein